MLPNLQQRFDALEESRRALFDDLRATTSEQLTFRPPDGGWCLLQAAEHMRMVDEAVIRQLAKNETLARKRTLKDRFGHLLVRVWLTLGLKAKAPGRMQPPVESSLEQIEEQWNAQRRDLKEYLETVTEADLERLATRHPVAGPVTLNHSIDFLTDHFGHHLRQIRRIRKAEGFP
jgi:uncharacterized damage-inducible protein DinB